MSKLVGYMEGTDPIWLTTLQAQGINTMPVANGLDGHGLNVRLLGQHNRPDLLVCYLHKLMGMNPQESPASDLLLPSKLYDIPVLVVCPRDYHSQARAILGDPGAPVELVDPADVLMRAKELLA